MAMRKKLWSISMLAVELGRDRRTVAKALGSVPRDGQLNGHDAWFLQTALHVLAQSSNTSYQVSLPPGFEVVGQVKDPIHQGMLSTLLTLVYEGGPMIATAAVASGASLRVAYTLHGMLIWHFAGEVEEYCSSLKVEAHPGAGKRVFNLEALHPVNWEALAKMAGEPCDIEAWQKWCCERSKTLPADRR